MEGTARQRWGTCRLANDVKQHPGGCAKPLQLIPQCYAAPHQSRSCRVRGRQAGPFYCAVIGKATHLFYVSVRIALLQHSYAPACGPGRGRGRPAAADRGSLCRNPSFTMPHHTMYVFLALQARLVGGRLWRLDLRAPQSIIAPLLPPCLTTHILRP